jgi:transcriptional regulator with XRE-family HTH domain
MPDQEPQGQGGASELASFGEELRREREIRGISLKEIADATKISKRFLEAIERNDHKTLPAPVFTRGFVREYSRYLGLNAEEMVNRYNFAAAGDDRIEKPPQVDRLHPQTPVRDITVPRPPRQEAGFRPRTRASIAMCSR